MVELQRFTAEEVGEWPTSLRSMYLSAYDEPPYNYSEQDADEFVERMAEQTRHPHFRLVVARDEELVAGFAYGYKFPTEVWWRGAKSPAPPEVADGTKFAVVELVVDRPFRGRGYSRLLMNDLLDQQVEEWGVLLAKPGAQAHQMYQRWGWRAVGEVQSYPHWPVDDAFVLKLKS